MSTTVKKMPPASLRRITSTHYGITEKKKAELDALMIEVLDAQFEVQQFQSVVTSLTDKLDQFNGYLADADANRTYTLNNRNLVDQLLQKATDLRKNSDLTFSEMGQANEKTATVSGEIKKVINKLIYSAEVINKVANLIVRKKALNPLISDELVSRMSTAGNDANNAVALTLVALKSAFAANATNMESQAATALEYYQSIGFYNALTGNSQVNDNIPVKVKPDLNGTSLLDLIYKAYKDAKEHYEQIHQACIRVTKELDTAQSQLDQATITLRSLQLGLSAGNAAALAS